MIVPSSAIEAIFPIISGVKPDDGCLLLYLLMGLEPTFLPQQKRTADCSTTSNNSLSKEDLRQQIIYIRRHHSFLTPKQLDW